jgi:hypothetical protein
MSDERDALLLHEFARSQRPLADAQFVAQVRGRLPVFCVRRLLGALGVTLWTILGGSR